ncbi:imidazole glycerol phosphate synthase subunit HisH [Alkalispirochaeta sphaeroplastigenens]|uniref:Imidazole glycerol phosphate synthase subunit HisH n=1 Tax=Alkalispirochaeta sphaeroplastigenens TaxID=1187066 RepID=A0A2S4JFY3_9SPIO|nr:imidazole glycerol phosphate synthase subunit HisH [Alkalispirochaeta sphaeroplastigenens]POQ98365.1 imidazole glycerol phosphate synthase subunit HisH [Alkalispirochaeta sphaeroplastigenens]
MITILDYGMGNCGSIKNMLRYLGADAAIVSEPEELENAKAIILPGVGSYDYGVKQLDPFKSVLEKKVLREKVPFLGICLGMQLLLESSEEGQLSGLGWIKGEAKRFDFTSIEGDQRLVVPHMGWNEVKPVTPSDIMQSVEKHSHDRFYFVHSYHADRVPEENQISVCHYGYDFTCAVQHKNIYGTQFHPEKSHKFGKQLFSRFIRLTEC